VTAKSQQAREDRKKAERVIADNRKAQYDFHLIETFEAGLALVGTEVKAIREGRVNLRDSFAKVEGGEVYVHNVHIGAYSSRGYADHEPLRPRKLLLHRQEIRKLIGKVKEQGCTLVPLKIYFNERGKAKLALGLARGKKLYDKRASLKQKEADREMQRVTRKKF